MIDFKEGKKKEKKVPVSVRLPETVREEAQKIAREQTSPDVPITESDIYRQIIVSFFSQSRVHNVHANSQGVAS